VIKDSPPDSPSFPTTSRIDDPRPDEVNTTLLTPGNPGHILRRRRSHLKRWIEDQQYIEPDDFFAEPESPVERVGTPCNPYLAYPHLCGPSKTLNEVGSLHNYVVVDDIVQDETHLDEDHVSVDSDRAEVRVFFFHFLILFTNASAYVTTCLPGLRWVSTIIPTSDA
jgi:hypothetical protein